MCAGKAAHITRYTERPFKSSASLCLELILNIASETDDETAQLYC